MAGYEKPETHPDRPVMTHRIVDEETYLASRQVAKTGDEREIDGLKPRKNTHRLR